MGVPNTTTFSLQDVIDEVNPTTDDLIDCFNDANSAYYNQSWKDYYYDLYNNKNNLLMFRDYGPDAWAAYMPYRTYGLDHISPLLYHSYSSVYFGGTAPDLGELNPVRAICDSNKTFIMSLGALPKIDFDPIYSVVTQEYVPGVNSLDSLFDNVSYGGSRTGVFYYRLEYGLPITGVLKPRDSTDTWLNDYLYYEFTIVDTTGITAAPDNWTFQDFETGSGVTEIVSLSMTPDVTFSVNITGDTTRFTVITSQVNNTISVYPNQVNSSPSAYGIDIEVTALGYNTENITIIQSTTKIQQ